MEFVKRVQKFLSSPIGVTVRLCSSTSEWTFSCTSFPMMSFPGRAVSWPATPCIDFCFLYSLNLFHCVGLLQISAIVTMGMSIYSSYNVISAFNELDARTDDVHNIIHNWETAPIMNVTATTSACPQGFEDLTTLTWPGTVGGPCACPRGARYDRKEYFSSEGICSANQTSARCVTDPAISSVRLSEWRAGKRICAERGGEAAVVVHNDKIVKERPQPTADGGCPRHYKRCGSGSYNRAAAICVPQSTACPIRELEVLSSADYNKHASNWSGRVELGNDMVLAFARDREGVLPLVDHTVGFKEVCIGSRTAQQFIETVGNVEGESTVASFCRDTGDRRYSSWCAMQRFIVMVALSFDCV